MARRTQIFMADDLTGVEGKDVVSIRYMVNNVTYEIDLSSESSEKFDKALQRFIKKSRIISNPDNRVTMGEQHRALSDIRQWCRDNGYDVGQRGRISQEALRAYVEGHK